MARPSLIPALNWQKYEQSVLDVFVEALNQLGQESTLPQGEEPLNLALYWKCLDIHLTKLKTQRSIPFVIEFDSTNQPEPDDTVESRRLKKRPDFTCVLKDEQATDFRKSQVRYSIECKRLGAASGQWIFTENYSEHGMLRFRQTDFGYAKGSTSAAMIGYVQNTADDELLSDVNQHARKRNLPSLSKAATAWAAKSVMPLSQNPITRDFDTVPLQLRHLWLDIRHCTFTVPQQPVTVPKATYSKKKSPKNSTGSGSKKTVSKTR